MTTNQTENVAISPDESSHNFLNNFNFLILLKKMTANQTENMTNTVEISLEDQLQREKETSRKARLTIEMSERIKDILTEVKTEKRERGEATLSSEGAERQRLRKRENACFDFWKSFQRAVERYDKKLRHDAEEKFESCCHVADNSIIKEKEEVKKFNKKQKTRIRVWRALKRCADEGLRAKYDESEEMCWFMEREKPYKTINEVLREWVKLNSNKK
jgi:hypothetical protein